jgi:hypothetical protein
MSIDPSYKELNRAQRRDEPLDEVDAASKKR